MNEKSIMGSNVAAVYEGKVESALISGDLEMTIGAEGILLDSHRNSIFVSYDSITAISRQDHVILLETRITVLKITKLGLAEEEFFQQLCATFTERVQAAFRPETPLLMELENISYSYGDCEGQATLRVFSDSILLLPPNLDARRLPFAFVSDFRAEKQRMTLSLKTGDQYSFFGPGHDFASLKEQLGEALRKLQADQEELLVKLDPELTRSQARRAVRLIPEGTAVLLSDLRAVVPTTAAHLEKMLSVCPLADDHAALQEITDVSGLAVAYKYMPARAKGSAGADWALWAVLPARDGRKAVLELCFPREKAATYVFETRGDYRRFLMTLNQAFEATSYRRQLLYLTKPDLHLKENAEIRMLLERTPALQELHKNFVGLINHHTVDSWHKNLQSMLR